MAQYTVTAGCGHTEVLHLVGSMQERERRLAWARSTMGRCRACYAASQREQEAATHEHEIAVVVSQLRRQYDGLPAAEQARAIESLRGALASGQGSPPHREAARQFLAAAAVAAAAAEEIR